MLQVLQDGCIHVEVLITRSFQHKSHLHDSRACSHDRICPIISMAGERVHGGGSQAAGRAGATRARTQTRACAGGASAGDDGQLARQAFLVLSIATHHRRRFVADGCRLRLVLFVMPRFDEICFDSHGMIYWAASFMRPASAAPVRPGSSAIAMPPPPPANRFCSGFSFVRALSCQSFKRIYFSQILWRSSRPNSESPASAVSSP